MSSKVRNKQPVKEPVTRRRDGRVKITSQGQISIPRQVMREAGVEPGDRLQASVDAAGRIVLEAEVDPLLALIGSAPPGAFDGAQAELQKMREEWDRSF